MSLDRFANQPPQDAGVDCIKLYRDSAEALCSAVAGLRRSGRQIPGSDLLGSNGQACEMDLGLGRHLAQRPFDRVAGVDAARVEVAEVVDVGGYVEAGDVIGGAV